MAIPTYDQFIEPILRHLVENPEGVRAGEAHDAAAARLGLSDDERSERLPSGAQAVYKNRAGWAHDRLKRAGLSESPRRGWWKLTPEGVHFANQHPAPLAPEVIANIAVDYLDVRLRPNDPAPEEDLDPERDSKLPKSPDERLETALAEIGESVAIEILEAIAAAAPQFFERLVLDVLHAAGYGTSRDSLRQVGGSGDGGIDGIISLDRLGLEKVYVQAKRWKGQTVSRPDVQAFYGALAGRRTTKGVFITTSQFTAQAAEFSNSVEQVVLVDGRQLAQLMIEHGVGVSHRHVKVPKLDSDYFED